MIIKQYLLTTKPPDGKVDLPHSMVLVQVRERTGGTVRVKMQSVMLTAIWGPRVLGRPSLPLPPQAQGTPFFSLLKPPLD